MVFTVHADRAEIDPADRPGARDDYFSTGRPCLRASDLGEKYGWGIHANKEARIGLYAVDSAEYVALSTGGRLPNDTSQPAKGTVTVLKAMRSSRR